MASGGSFSNATIDALDDSLAHVYKLDETSGTRYDSVGSKDLTDVNTVGYATGKRGNAADFVAANKERLSAGADIFKNRSQITISLWVRFDNSDRMRGIVESTSSAAYGRITIVKENTNKIFVAYRDTATGTSYDAISDNAVSTGDWYHFLAAFDSVADTIKLYVNGDSWISASKSGMGTTENVDSAAPLTLGALSSSDINYTDGLIDEVYIWFDVFSNPATASSALYNSGDGRFWKSSRYALKSDGRLIIKGVGSAAGRELQLGGKPTVDLLGRPRIIGLPTNGLRTLKLT